MYRRIGSIILPVLLIHSVARLAAQEGGILPPAPTPTDVKPGSITCDECPYPYPSKYLDLRVYTQDVRIAYMDVAPQGTANGRTVVLLHGNNFAGFYFKPVIDRPMAPIDESYQQTLKSNYQSIRVGLSRYVAHNPKAWNADFETYTRIRYSWTLSADWPRLAMVQALIGQMLYADPVVYDWAHIQVPTLAFGGAEDMLLGPAARFQERMQYLANAIPNGNGRVLLLPGLGHVPHLEAPGQVLPPLVAFLKEGLAAK
jgi:pimeloyl-ACP methyl ester carboxylesterase